MASRALRTTNNLVLRTGLIFGALMAVWQTATTIFLRIVIATTISHAELAAFFYLTIVGYAAMFLAGRTVAKASGKVTSGTLAGMTTGLVCGLVSGITTLVLDFVPAMSSNHYGSSAALLTAALIGIVWQLILNGSLGAGLGVLGALVGKSAYRGPAATIPAMPGNYPYQAARDTGYPTQPGSYQTQSDSNYSVPLPYPEQ
jgi:hypothetical protein